MAKSAGKAKTGRRQPRAKARQKRMLTLSLAYFIAGLSIALVAAYYVNGEDFLTKPLPSFSLLAVLISLWLSLKVIVDAYSFYLFARLLELTGRLPSPKRQVPTPSAEVPAPLSPRPVAAPVAPRPSASTIVRSPSTPSEIQARPAERGLKKKCPYCERELPYGDIHIICPFCGRRLK